jgi:hypothetical protein
MLPLIVPAVVGIIDKLIPDPERAAEAKLRALEMAQRGDLAALDAEMRLALAQADVNKAEAQTDMFRGGWRPFCGWTCGAGLAYEFLVRPLLPWIVASFGASVEPLPNIDSEALMALLFGMLGLGGLRTIERVRGKA